MTAYAVAVLDRDTKQVCMSPEGAYEEYVGAVYALGK